MKISKFLLNYNSPSPSAGLRGALALGVALTAPFWTDWRSDGWLLAVVVVVGIFTALSLFSQASKHAG